MKLQGKIAIVTGVSKGIGFATVKALLGKGVKVAGWGRTAPEIQHNDFKFYKTDVGERASVLQAYETTVKDFGAGISILINNAGLGYGGYIDEMPAEEWTEMFNTNVHGVFYCSQALIPSMKKLGEAHIINIASIAGKEGFEQLAGYCGTKFAVRGISQAMYKELRDYGIKVTSICPGSVQTNFFDHIDHIQANENMMKAEDIAGSIVQCLETSANYHPVELEFRPLMPKGKR